ncbi:ribonuclease J [Mycoplasmopsis meleagridis]|uniref:Putative hydrolase n=1 Tax=Mycoplasmopsis meleagridis ATCC 25294 TaxID=1264554 RepID=A0A0F5H0A7_9BACT|nr:ribonuclease J [Mycoplasmopsis meleagridis]KKB26756.1 putative hydrolase [Mycoplasmopsis meleagridis ATCC 25294]VEU77290.1 hydrolase [Mycoplasmopsis meleagridis]
MTPTRIIPIGGVQEIGKSTLIVEHDKHIFIIDAGVKFADVATTGIRSIIPNYAYLKAKAKNIEGLFITHGHEDHIGGVVHLVKEVHIKKIFAPRISIQYLKLKFEEHKITNKITFIETEKEAVHTFGDCKVDFWTAQHSIPDAFGIRITTPNGSIMCTGDFRFDYNPIGSSFTDFAKLDQIGKDGLTILMSDSTNAMRPMHSPSENDILRDIEKYMRFATKKTIITAFASNLTRVTAIIELAEKLKKKVIAFGRSMIQGIEIGNKLGYIDVNQGVFINKKDLNSIPSKDLVIITTGSQGEQLAALSRMSLGKHHHVKIEKDDMIIFSSSPIPGNRMVIELLVNRLAKLGAIIKENGVDGYLHTSGHAYKHEHDKIFQLTKPKFFMPYHGEYRMLIVHGESAVRNGVRAENIIIPKLGKVYNMVNQRVYETDENVEFGPIYIDGNTILSLNNNLLKERAALAENGFVSIVLSIDSENNNVSSRPSLISRGSFFVKNSTDIVEEAKRIAHGAALYYIRNVENWTVIELKNIIKERLENYFYKQKRRKPVIMPIILFSNDENDEEFNNSPIKFTKNTNFEAEETKETLKLLNQVKNDIFGSIDEIDDDFLEDEDEE